MATLDSRLARLAAAQQRTAAALKVISNELGVVFDNANFPREADEPMKRVLLMEQYADWIEQIADSLVSEVVEETSMNVQMAPKRRVKKGTRKGK